MRQALVALVKESRKQQWKVSFAWITAKILDRAPFFARRPRVEYLCGFWGTDTPYLVADF